MNRRTFATTVAAALAFLASPFKAWGAAPATVDGLIEWCENRWRCAMGPASASMVHAGREIFYRTLKVCAFDETTAVAAMREHMVLMSRGDRLWWRLPQRIVGTWEDIMFLEQDQPLRTPTGKVVTLDMVDDGVHPQPDRSKYVAGYDAIFYPYTLRPVFTVRARVCFENDLGGGFVGSEVAAPRYTPDLLDFVHNGNRRMQRFDLQHDFAAVDMPSGSAGTEVA